MKRNFSEHSETNWDKSAPVVEAVPPSIKLPLNHGSSIPYAKKSVEKILTEEESRGMVYSNRQPINRVVQNPFPRIKGMPTYPFEISGGGIRYWFNRGLSPWEAYLCDRLYHTSASGFVFPILASVAPREAQNPQLIGKVVRHNTMYLVMCPTASDDFNLYARIMAHLWDACTSCENGKVGPEFFLHRFARCCIDWRVFHENREVLAVKLMWYLDDRIPHEEFWEDMLKFILPLYWDGPWKYPDSDDVPDSFRIVRDAVYFPILPPPRTNEFYDRIRFMPVFWSEL